MQKSQLVLSALFALTLLTPVSSPAAALLGAIAVAPTFLTIWLPGKKPHSQNLWRVARTPVYSQLQK